MSSTPSSHAAPVPLYRRIADDLEELIHSGTLPPGSRLPSLRQTSRRRRVSVTTAMEAYRLLEDRGIVEVRPQSGHYVCLAAVRQPPEPERTATCREPAKVDTSRLMERVLDEASRPGLVVPFGAAVPHPDFLPTSRLNTLLSRALRREPVTSQVYGTVQGRLELRREIARLAFDGGVTLTPDELVITTGAQEAIGLALRAVTKPGDTVAIESPTYPGFLRVLESLHLKARQIATDPREGICLEALDEALEDRRPGHRLAAVLLVPNFGNPLGHRMAADDKLRLVRRLDDAEVPLIEDDTYGELPHVGSRPRTLRSFDEVGNVLLLSSFSKILAPGLRVGWLAPGRYAENVLRLKYANTLASATPTQMAIAEYLAAGRLPRHLRGLRRSFKDLTSRMITEVGEHFPAGTRVTRPSGGFVLWVEAPEGVDCLALHQAALDEGISIVPGPIFSPSGRYRHCLRLSCAVPWSDTVERAIRRVGELASAQLEGAPR
ncbi:MAG: PLP-dependent aminotransferase family protein [Acidobacteriota bacterium]